MKCLVRVPNAVAVLLVVWAIPLATAQSDLLQEAIDLFEAQEYKASQETLLKIDPETLTEAEQAELDAFLERVPLAIQGKARAEQDLATADEAFDAGNWEAAAQAYADVIESEYSSDAWKSYAAAQIRSIDEKRSLADAARPEGAVEESAPVDEAASQPEEPTVEVVPMEPAEDTAVIAVEEPRRLTPADQLRMIDELNWQRAVVKADSLADAARTAMAERDFVAARKQVNNALQVIEAARRFADPASKYQGQRDALNQLKSELEQEARAYEAELASQEQIEIKKRIAERKRLYEQQKREKVDQLFRSAAQLRRERRFGEAAEVLREVLRIDPGNARARYQLDVAEDYESFAEQRQWQHDVYTQQRQALVNAEEALIPWDVDVLYPKNWLELTAHRTALGTSGTLGTIEDSELNRKLDEPMPEFRFEEQPFDQVVEWFAEFTKVNISVDWTDLEDMGIDREHPVNIRLSAGLSFRTVLEEVLAQVGGDVQLAYAVGDGLLRIATKTKLDRNKLILIYDIRDLLIHIPDASRDAAFDVTQGMGEGGQQGGGGGGGQGMFGEGEQDEEEDYDEEDGEAGQALAQRIIEIIRDTVEPDSWRETGGGDGSIRELNGQLIVYNTNDAHSQVADLLRQLRAQQSLQISVETRFLNVTSNFLEQFGVDLDFVFNSGSAGYDRGIGADGGVLTDPFSGAPILVDRNYSRIGSYATTPGFGNALTPGGVPSQPYGQAAFVPNRGGIGPHVDEMTPITAQQGSLSLVDLTGRSTGVPGSFASQAGLTPALNIAGSYLDNLQVDFLIRATQANARSSIVQAPRLVLFNGQAASISVGRSRTYVSSLEPQLAEGAVGFRPETASADSGVSMWVEGTISADRRYVTLTLDVRQRDEPSFERFEIQRASGNSPGAFILLPDYAFAVLTTTVSVPDGGTVLLGGLKQVGEVEVDAGVPILSKIPILKRAFTNQTQVKDTRTLLILVKTKIIIQQEAEEEAFPTFTQAMP